MNDRELEARIAEKIMGFSDIRLFPESRSFPPCFDDLKGLSNKGFYEEIPQFLSDKSAAMDVLSTVTTHGRAVAVHIYGTACCIIEINFGITAEKDCAAKGTDFLSAFRSAITQYLETMK